MSEPYLGGKRTTYTKQAEPRTLYMWTGNDTRHANWYTLRSLCSARQAQQPMLEQPLNLQATEIDHIGYFKCEVNIQKIA
jgi:hypothetical protein